MRKAGEHVDPEINRRLLALTGWHGHSHFARNQPRCSTCRMPLPNNGAGLCVSCERASSASTINGKLKDLHPVYRIASASLRRRLEELEANNRDALVLRNELALCRVAAERAVNLFGEAHAVHEAAQASDDPQIKRDADDALRHAANMMLDSLRNVKDFALDAARVETMSKGSYSQATVNIMMVEIMRCMRDAVERALPPTPEGEARAHDVARLFEELVAERVRLITVGDESSVSGTKLTPERLAAQVIDMDSTVPRVAYPTEPQAMR